MIYLLNNITIWVTMYVQYLLRRKLLNNFSRLYNSTYTSPNLPSLPYARKPNPPERAKKKKKKKNKKKKNKNKKTKNKKKKKKKNKESLLPRFHANQGSPPFHQLAFLRTHKFADTYFDRGGILSKNGLWVRERVDEVSKVRGAARCGFLLTSFLLKMIRLLQKKKKASF